MLDKLKSEADQLRELLEDPQSGILIDARHRLGPNGETRFSERAAFRLPSGRLQQKFIMVAGLFRNREIFDTCVVRLAAAAEEIIEANGSAPMALASCTATARYLMKHIHARLSSKRKVPAGYHGMYPLLPARPIPKYVGEHVFLIVDVVGTGTLCRDLADDVKKCGGNVAGIFSIFWTGKRQPTGAPAIVLNNGTSVPVITLCHFPLPAIAADQVNFEEVEDIDTATLFRRLIADPKNGMLIDAREHDRLNYETAPAQNPVFELTSGVYQRQFVTSWAIFDKPWYFEACMEYLAKLARDIRSKPEGWFSVIVTCTGTGRHIMDHLQSRVETSEDPVKVYYLGPFPFHVLRNRNLDLRDQRVLIITDVISEGRMVRNIMSVVERLKGTPVAVISLVGLVRQENYLPAEALPCEDIDQKGGTVRLIPVHYLTSYCIPVVSGRPDRIYRIDPNTVLPVESQRKQGFGPMFPTSECIRHFENSRSLKMGFYSAGPRILSAALRIPRLLEHAGQEIWDSISRYLDAKPVLVTTFGKEDLAFHAFVEQRAARDWKTLDTVFIPRSDSIYSDFPYFVTREIRARLQGKSILLLLASLQTSEKLRKLVALLAQSGVERIQVICLLNRMGTRTVEFVSRIYRMAENQREEGAMGFAFRYVYDVRDLHGDQLSRTLDTIDWLANQYSSSTAEQSYRALTEREIALYFRTSSLTGREFEELKAIPKKRSDAGEIHFRSESWKYTTLDGKLYAMCCYVARKRDAGDVRDYAPIIEAVSRERDRATLYLLFVILLSDVSYLRLAGFYMKLRGRLMKAVLDSQNQRIRQEKRWNELPRKSDLAKRELGRQIRKAVQTETSYLFGLALFCYMDEDRQPYRDFISRVLTNSFSSPQSWLQHPMNLQRFYGNERVLWCISMLVHFAVPAGATEIRSELLRTARQYSSFIKNLPSLDPAWEKKKQAQSKLKYVWDAFLTDLGGYERQQRDQVLRYLQSVLIEPRGQHILVVSEPKRANLLLQSVVLDHGGKLNYFPETKLIRFGSRFADISPHLDDAIQASATLERVADAIGRLFAFHAVGTREASRYVAGIRARTPGFQAQVQELRRLLQKIRDERTITKAQMRTLSEIQMAIERDLTLRNSEILQALFWYIVPFHDKLGSAIKEADRYLMEAGFPEVWKQKIQLDANPTDYVLMDPSTLKDILWNMCTNIRYGLSREEDPADQIQYGIERTKMPAPEGDEIEVLHFWVESPLRRQMEQIRSTATLSRQQLYCEQYGGKLEFSKRKDRFRADLQLLLRNRTYEAWKERFPSR